MTDDAEDDVYTEDQDAFEHFRFVADGGQSIIRIDKFLFDRLPNASRSKISEAARNGNVLVNGKPVKQNYKVKPGDEISIVFPEPKRDLELIAEDIPLNIVYEDDHLVVIDKPANFVVHPGHGNYTGTLVNALLHHFGKLPKNKSSETAFPGLVHRIDKDTTGLLVIAKSETALNKLASAFFQRKIERNYLALVWGDVEDDSGTIVGNIGRSEQDRMQMAVYPPDSDKGKPAVTHYKVLERLGYVTLVSCKLETGRTHQIRAHMKHIGHPLFGDVRYGGNRIVKGTTFSKYKQFISNCFEILPRQALHAHTLGFEHPATGKWLTFESPLPDDIQRVVEKWRNYIAGSRE
ncbi:MAG: RluA family pseudouridine synthase [Salibacteraceae bacterium]